MLLQKNRTSDTICEAGIRMFVMINCEKVSDSLADLRCFKHMKITSSLWNIKPESLLPIERASMFHACWYVSNFKSGTHSLKVPCIQNMEVEVSRCLGGASYDGWRTCTIWTTQDNMMQLSKTGAVENSVLATAIDLSV